MPVIILALHWGLLEEENPFHYEGWQRRRAWFDLIFLLTLIVCYLHGQGAKKQNNSFHHGNDYGQAAEFMAILFLLLLAVKNPESSSVLLS